MPPPPPAIRIGSSWYQCIVASETSEVASTAHWSSSVPLPIGTLRSARTRYAKRSMANTVMRWMPSVCGTTPFINTRSSCDIVCIPCVAPVCQNSVSVCIGVN